MRQRLLVATLALIAGPVFAHDTWLLPVRFETAPGSQIVARATSAMRFPRSEMAMKPDRVARSGVRLGGRTSALRLVGMNASALEVRAEAHEPGVATLWLESRPRTLDLKNAEVEEYLREIGAWDTTGAEWQQAGRRPWRETYTKCAKSFVRVGAATMDRGWEEPVGLALEIVPEADPTSVRIGQKLTVRILRDGKALAGLGVGAQAASRKATLVKTDEAGRVTFLVDRGGPWLVKATSLRPGDREGEWISQFTTLTFAAK